MVLTRSGKDYAAPVVAPGALETSEKGTVSEEEGELVPPEMVGVATDAVHCDRCQAPVSTKAKEIIENDRELHEWDEIRCGFCDAIFSLEESDAYVEHMVREHADELLDSDGSATELRDKKIWCKFCTWSVVADKSFIKSHYAHMQKDHPRRLEKIMKNASRIIAKDNEDISSALIASGVFACSDCNRLYPCPRSGYICEFCIYHCPQCVPTLPVTSPPSPEKPSLLATPSTPTTPATAAPSPSTPTTATPTTPTATDPTSTSSLSSSPLTPSSLNPAEKVDAFCQTEDVNETNSLSSVRDIECSSSGVDPTSVPISTSTTLSAIPLPSEPIAITSKLSPLAAPFLPRPPAGPKRTRSRRRPRRRSKSRRRKKDSGSKPVTSALPDQSPPVATSVVPSSSPAISSKKSPRVVTPPASPTRALPPVSPSNGSRRSRSRSRNCGRDRSRSEEKSPAPILAADHSSRERRSGSSSRSGRGGSAEENYARRTSSSPRFNDRPRVITPPATPPPSGKSFPWVPPPPRLDVPPSPFFLENLHDGMGEVYTVVQGLKIPDGKITLFSYITQMNRPKGYVRIHPLVA